MQETVKPAKNPTKKQKTEMGNLFSSSPKESSSRHNQEATRTFRSITPRAAKFHTVELPKTAVRKIGVQKKQDRVTAWVNETVSPEKVVAPKIHDTGEVSGYLSDKYGRRPW